MAARVTDEELEEIIEVESGDTLTPFITAANLLVTKLCTDSDYSDGLLAAIELWLAAHFYAIKQPRYASETAGVAVTYQHKVDMGFKVTTYGQQALLLDTEGNLAAVDAQVSGGQLGSIGVTWLGTEDTSTEVE